MRYLITGSRSSARVILGYDAEGLLCEVQVEEMPTDQAREWPFRHAPLRVADVKAVFASAHLKFEVLNATFQDFWLRYNYKAGKKDAERAWGRMSEANRQRAFSYIRQYQADCHRNNKHLMYPASYLRAERWNDHT